MHLDHISIVAADCADLRSFFVEIVGMQEGARPTFRIGGHWLYLDGRPILHLIERPVTQANTTASDVKPSIPPARIDHMALRLDNAVEWQTLLQRLNDRQIPYQLAEIPSSQQLQLFVTPVPAVTVEFQIGIQDLK
jgi:extradiol dioxygenase family protein